MILYDRIIDVSFYRHNKIVDVPFKMCNPTNLKTGTARSTQGFHMWSDAGVLEFHKGRTRVIQVDTVERNGQTVSKYKRQFARGILYTVRTMDDMKKGVTPQGTPFHSGDLIRVIENNSLWNVYVTGSTESFYTDSEYEVPESVLTIKSTDYGMKPAMSLEISLLPGQNCYAAVLRITNLNLSSIEIRTWERMRIIAGYRDGKKALFDCPIFTSYIESPNPDGVTVFEGLTIGAVDNILLDKYIVVKFIQRSMNIVSFITAVAKGIASDIDVNIALGEHKNDMIEIEPQSVYTQNGAATLNWLQNFVSAYIKRVSKDTEDVFIQFHDGILDIILLTGEKQIPTDAVRNAISLDSITGASFAGPSLNVIAPWNPALLPGQLFFMPPNFYSGSSLPNALPFATYRTPENLYRVITMSLSFSTTENTNKMTILALPALSKEQRPATEVLQMSADAYAQMEKNVIDIPETELKIGSYTSDMLPLLDDPSIITKTGVPFIDNHSNILQLWPEWTTIPQKDYTGHKMSEIADYYLFHMLGGPKLQDHGAGVNKEKSYKPPKDNFGASSEAARYYMNSGLNSVLLWYPLMALGTYWRRQADIAQQKNNNWCDVRSDNPDFVRDGTTVFVPVFTGTWNTMKAQLAAVKDIWKDAYLSYPKPPREWKIMYYYLGGTGEF